MEVVVGVVSAVTSSVVSKLLAVAENRCEQLKNLEGDISFMHRELPMMYGAMEDQLSQQGQPSAAQIKSMEEFRVLAHDIEDCLDRFLPCAACEGESIHDPGKFGAEMRKLKKKLVEAQQRRAYYASGVNHQASAVVESDATEDTATHEASPAVGIEKPVQELWDLLVGGVQEGQDKLRVISIVGFGGSGKTALAWALYEHDRRQVDQKFLRRAWVEASKHREAKGLLTAILEGLLGEEGRQPVPHDIRQLQQQIRGHLEATRCLIVIDDIKFQLWDAIKPMFPENTESRILVTTAIQSIANKCSLQDGYVYNMRSLSAKQSNDLLEKYLGIGSSPDLMKGSTAIVNKCDGLPLALVSVAKLLQGHIALEGDHCEGISKNLCSHMDENKNGDFTKLRQVLMNNYSSLPSNSHKTCLLYTSVFPNDRPFSRNSLIRRLSAEGYVECKHPCSDLEVADKNLEELIDRNIIRPIDTSNNARVKTCRTHGTMHQFMLHKSRSSNFIATSFGGKNRSNFRHLVIQNHRNGTIPAKYGKDKQLRPRSLTVFGNVGEAVSALTNCELLRVLDLKECNDLKDEHLDNIRKLLHLKYLTLGSTISNLPGGIKNLHCLETLDLRMTKIEKLPVEVITLPHLAHLFGKIKLELGKKWITDRDIEKLLPGGSNLQTLAGVVTDENSVFPQLMVHMKQLRKVEIWCEPTDSNTILNSLSSESIQKFAKAGMDTPVGARCLSLHFNNYCKDLLHRLENTSGYLSSLKLQGKLSKFPQFVISLPGLKELCLTSTNLTGADLSNLCTLKYLVCLKLVEVHLGGLHIKLGDLPSLQRLCLVVKNPRFPTIQQGALPNLVSLQLLCEGLVGLCDIKMEWFQKLQELALDSLVNEKTMKAWENEAKKHPKRPRVLLLKRIIDRSKVKYVAIDQGIIGASNVGNDLIPSSSTW